MRHAHQRADRVLIMSAKYGLIPTDAPISWYEAYVPTLTSQERDELKRILTPQLKQLKGIRVLSYVSNAYQVLLVEVDLTVASAIHRPYCKLNFLTALKVLSNEIASYGQNPSRR